jgi:hypothetical protein
MTRKGVESRGDRQRQLRAAAESDVRARRTGDFDPTPGRSVIVQRMKNASRDLDRLLRHRAGGARDVGRGHREFQARSVDHHADAAELSLIAITERKHPEVQPTRGLHAHARATHHNRSRMTAAGASFTP